MDLNFFNIQVTSPCISLTHFLHIAKYIAFTTALLLSYPVFCQTLWSWQVSIYTDKIHNTVISKLQSNVLCFGENPQAVTYSAEPLCWSSWESWQVSIYTDKIHNTVISKLQGNVLCFGENPQAVAYSAEPLCWSSWESSSPTTLMGAVWKNGAEIPWG